LAALVYSAPVPRSAAIVAVCFPLALAGCGGGGHHTNPAEKLTISPAGDAYVAVGQPTHGYGPTLRAGGRQRARTYLVFALGALRGKVTHAVLRLHPSTGSRVGIQVQPVKGLTWKAQLPSGKPALQPPAKTVPTLTANQWRNIDVTKLARSATTLALAITSRAQDEITLASSESGSFGPELIVHARTRTAAFQKRIKVAKGSTPVIAAAGDISCDPRAKFFNAAKGTGNACTMGATAKLIQDLRPTAVLVLGDSQYEDGSLAKFQTSYQRTWGPLKPITHPAVGNHEYVTPNATGYYRYFGAAAGAPQQGWYSFNIGSWHLISLNSECGYIGGCGKDSPQETWLKADLENHKAHCTLAYWHEPRFSSGQHGDNQLMATIFNDLVAAKADIVLSGHNHDYERFDPIGRTPQGPGGAGGAKSFQPPNLDPSGIREFIVGTGGRDHKRFRAPPLNGERARNDDTYGVLELKLGRGTYSWSFVPVGGRGGVFRDSGSGRCH
jgi:acid phosphatase type 7